MRILLILLLLIVNFSCLGKPQLDSNKTTVSYEKAWHYLENGESINAFIYFEKAKNIFLKQKDSLGVGKCLMNMAIIQEKMGDVFGGQETAINALSYFDEKRSNQYEYISANYNTLGITSSKLKEYKKAVEFYQNALKFTSNLQDKTIYQNNLANT